MIGTIKNGMIMMAIGILGITVTIVMSIIDLIVTICVIGMMAIAVFIRIIATMFKMNKIVGICDEIVDKIVDYLDDKWD